VGRNADTRQMFVLCHKQKGGLIVQMDGDGKKIIRNIKCNMKCGR
jgi:hypothetical protein